MHSASLLEVSKCHLDSVTPSALVALIPVTTVPASASLGLQKPARHTLPTHYQVTALYCGQIFEEKLSSRVLVLSLSLPVRPGSIVQSILLRDFTPIRRAVITTGRLSTVLLFQYVRWHTKVEGTPALVCPVGR